MLSPVLLLLHPSFLAIFVLFFFPIVSSPSAVNSISGNQTLSVDQTLTCTDGKFVLGFFPLGSSPRRYYLGIWYNTRVVSKFTPIWVANRGYAITDPASFELMLSDNGDLVIADRSMDQIWSTDAHPISNSTVAVLLDNGNLVLRDKSNASLTFWQSFDYPTDTWLPGAKLGFSKLTGRNWQLVAWANTEDPAPGVFQLQFKSGQISILSNDSIVFWSSGRWNGAFFSFVPENTFYSYTYFSSKNEDYVIYMPIRNDTIIRLFIDISGQVKQWIWVESVRQWLLFFSQPSSACEVYALCGAFGSCSVAKLPFCGCLKGFSPRSPEDWALGDQSRGCVRNTALQCGGNSSVQVDDMFYRIESVRLPGNINQSAEVGDVSECESACLRNCSCSAYAYATKCSLWYGDLLNLQEEYSGTNEAGTLFLRLAASELSNPDKIKKGSKIMLLVVAICVPIGVVLLSIIACIIWTRKRRYKGSLPSKKDETPLTWGTEMIVSELISKESSLGFSLYQFSSIVEATGNFSAANKLGEGGFGPVYKGQLPDGEEIAVKRLAARSGQGLEEFMNEIMLIAKLQHQNLVKLLGCCVEGDEKLLVYEYMPNISLDFFLFDEVRKNQLDWSKRIIIIDGIAHGLLYLHKYSRVRIIHRDLKASNILLDAEMNPKISDFGMARIFQAKATEANTNRIVGTYGYMSPEYAMEGLFSVKSDVFSFGVLVLEIISGKRNTTFHKYGKALNLLAYAWELWQEARWMELVDPSLSDKTPTREVLKCIHVALLCVQEQAADRPTMPEALNMLGSESANLPEPKKPAFFTAGNEGASELQILEGCSQNEVTLTVLSCR
ncbi:Receptor-like serine/threonine-protein kinase SD1-8 [Apostasia shenzhenica]|uniref:Receptor-like serine/threonine-protein kinase n=1 Tax=Apostasia shenzhenica TaxID=1088818 RepID=A0A2I0ABX1_9ASPA|nr:Receptor-like serine/threonine-protein kinase SD1-8 [Apostasia shenzhenica]